MIQIFLKLRESSRVSVMSADSIVTTFRGKYYSFEKRSGRSLLLRFKCVYVNSALSKSYVWRRPVDDFIYFIMEL